MIVLSSIDITRLKHKKLWFLIITGIVFLAIIISWFRPEHQKIKKHINHSLIEVKYDDDSMQKWTTASELQLKDLLTEQATSKKLVEKQNMFISELQKKENEQSRRLSKLEDKIIRIKIQQAAPIQMTNTPTSNQAGNQERLISPIPNTNSTMEVSYPSDQKEKKQHTIANNFMNKLSEKKMKENNFLGWLPMGSFFSAILLNGVEAGTGSNAEANPQPVLMRITDNAILPNIYRYNIASCFVLGSAYGSLSSERAFIRTTEISCVGHNGRAVITSPLKGFIVDSDGKIGLRGLLVNRQGEKLGKAMLSGFFSGLSGAVGQAQGASTTGPLGMINMLSATASLRMAGLNGVSNATNELAQFYIGEAKRLFPVIEINAGRSVTINLSQGVSLRWQAVTKQPLRASITPNYF